MMHYLLADVICRTFLKDVGKWQAKSAPNEKAMRIVFKTGIDHDKEEGYRFLELVVYGPMNYVQVWTRTSWNVIPLADMEDGDDGEMFVKKGKAYQEGASEWKLIADHDSGWRDGVRDLLRENESNLHVFDRLGDWYGIVEVESLGLPEKG